MTKSQARENEDGDEDEKVFWDESAKFNLSSKTFQETSRHSLAFINLTTSTGATQDPGKRRLVRSHVMRNIQQQKQMQEYGEWQEQRLMLPDESSFVVREMPGLHNVTTELLAQEGVAEPVFGRVRQNLDWNPSTCYQSLNIGGLQDYCVSSTSIPANDKTVPIENISYNRGSSNFANTLYHEDPCSQDSDAAAQGEEPLSKILDAQPSQLPLGSQNIMLNSPSRGRIDPFDTLPGFRYGRAQALVYHCNWHIPLQF